MGCPTVTASDAATISQSTSTYCRSAHAHPRTGPRYPPGMTLGVALCPFRVGASRCVASASNPLVGGPLRPSVPVGRVAPRRGLALASSTSVASAALAAGECLGPGRRGRPPAGTRRESTPAGTRRDGPPGGRGRTGEGRGGLASTTSTGPAAAVTGAPDHGRRLIHQATQARLLRHSCLTCQ
jgi:hypothetical protein